ncbi:MAG: PEP/pyruvate-binding domain-containing protein [Patescibacteria group bacterium]
MKESKKPNKKSVSEAGGKGASLGEMTNAKMPVPPGFVVLSSVFNRFLEETDLDRFGVRGI